MSRQIILITAEGFFIKVIRRIRRIVQPAMGVTCMAAFILLMEEMYQRNPATNAMEIYGKEEEAGIN